MSKLFWPLIHNYREADREKLTNTFLSNIPLAKQRFSQAKAKTLPLVEDDRGDRNFQLLSWLEWAIETEHVDLSLADRAAKQIEDGIKGRAISFGLTAERLPPYGEKGVTRRQWSEPQVNLMLRYADRGQVLPAVDKGLHRGGKQIGWVQILDVYSEVFNQMPESHLRWEGCPEMMLDTFKATFFKKLDPLEPISVVWFLYEPLVIDAVGDRGEEG